MFRENDYQAMRILKRNERENILNALGLFEKKKIIHVKEKLTSKSSISADKRRSEPFDVKRLKLDSRRSLRIQTKSIDDFGNNVVSKILSSNPVSKVVKVRIKKSVPNVYGSVKNISIGDTWNTRIECSQAGVHRPTVAGIHPGKEGAYSVAISGEYEDDQDNGYCFTYTGSGGRDLTGTKDNKKNLRTGPQSKDQTPKGANASLIKSIETRNPVRVIRGYKLDSPFAPETGYRYDGLYTVEKYWTCTGKSGFRVYKFLMKRCANQPPAPWHTELKGSKNRIKIVKLRKKKPVNKSTVLNLTGKLTMNEGNGDKVTTCQFSGMKLKLNTDNSKSMTIGSPDIFIEREFEIQLDPNETIAYQRKETASSEKPSARAFNRACVIKCKKRIADESNKENKVIIKTRWRRTRLSLPNVRSRRTSLPEPTNINQSKRRYRKRLSFPEKSNTRRSSTSRGSQYKTPPSIAYFNASNEKSFKWSLFASKAELKKYQRHFRKSNSLPSGTTDDSVEEFRGFDRQDSLNKVMILGFLINDLQNK